MNTVVTATRAVVRPSLSADVMSGLVVFVVALPLSLGIGLASGMPPVSALVAAIVGGIVVGSFSGAPIVVSGPAAGLSALVLTQVHEYGIEAVYAIAVLAGVFQVIMGLARLGQHISKIPKPVLEGVLCAIGATIVLSQAYVLMGQKIPGAPVANIQGFVAALGRSFGGQFATFVAPALLLGLVAAGIQLLWPHVVPRLKWLPAALPATAIGTLVSLGFDVPRVHLDALAPHVAHAASNFFMNLGAFPWSIYLIPALGLGLVASAESLLTARALDVLVSEKMPHVRTNLNRELLAQGLGNLVSGSLGGMPITGVMVRSAANFTAGATSRLSTILHGVFVAISVMALSSVMERIPLSVLAAVLILTGWRLLNIRQLVHHVRRGPLSSYLWPLTTVAILATDLLKGFGIGLVAALLLYVFSRRQKTTPETAAEKAAA